MIEKELIEDGDNAVYQAAMADVAKVDEYTQKVRNSDPEHEIYRRMNVDDILDKWGWVEPTVRLFCARFVWDYDLRNEASIKGIKKNKELQNLFLNIFREEFKLSTFFLKGNPYVKFETNFVPFIKLIFGLKKDETEQLARIYYDLLLDEAAIDADDLKNKTKLKAKVSHKIFATNFNKALTSLRLSKLEKERRDTQYQTLPRVKGQNFGDSRFFIRVGTTQEYCHIELIDVNLFEEKAKPETLNIGHKISSMLPFSACNMVGLDKNSLTVRTHYEYTNEITPTEIENDLCYTIGIGDIFTHIVAGVNNQTISSEQALPELLKIADAYTPTELADMEPIKQKLLTCIEKTPELKLEQVNENLFIIKYANQEKGDTFGVVSLYPSLNQLSWHIPYYKGENFDRSEIGEWCFWRGNDFYGGGLTYDAASGYVWHYLPMHISQIIDDSSFNFLLETLSEDPHYFGSLIDLVVKKKYKGNIRTFLKDEDKYKDKLEPIGSIPIPDDLSAIGIYPYSEKIMYAFREHGRKLLKP